MDLYCCINLICDTSAVFQASLTSPNKEFLKAIRKKMHLINPAFDRWLEDAFDAKRVGTERCNSDTTPINNTSFATSRFAKRPTRFFP